MSGNPGAPVKFPKITRMNQENPFVFFSKDKVLALYRQHTGKEAKNLAKKVSEWFKSEAMRQGWEVRSVKPYGNGNNAGFVLWVAKMFALEVISQTIVRFKHSR